jgi:hypothetical protein
MTNEEFAQMVLSKVPPEQPFQPMARYDPDGDCIEFLASNESFYARRIDSLVTVYYSQETQEVVGALIKGVSQFLRQVVTQVPGFKIEIEDSRIKLEHFFTARLWSTPADPKEAWVVTYKKLREVAERSGAEAAVDDLVLT